MNFIGKFSKLAFRILIPKSLHQRFVNVVMSSFELDPLHYAHQQQGILKYQNNEVSGELFVLKEVLPKVLCADGTDDSHVVIFDVGANEGEYTQYLLDFFPKAAIYSFEPNPNTFNKLSKFKNESRVKLFNIGFNDKKCKAEIFTYDSDHSSCHASVYQDVLSTIHKSENITHIPIRLEDLDSFCKENNVKKIDFLKIDTEGNEYRVLEGAKKLIKNDNIKAIQFEFNEMNVISRVFFKDFFDLLGTRYNLYRLDSQRLIPIVRYDSVHEIFKFQNILALQKNWICDANIFKIYVIYHCKKLTHTGSDFYIAHHFFRF